ncbi:MAG: orotate phosphoribosyltransferase [Gammaproteobacteria bacterium]|nr:orotate phosphoribosyltransferase [Gammaproteobacteria bacterium]
MQKYQLEFIEFAIQYKVLCFGDYTLKSGRLSPYFFNSGLFNDGHSLARLGRFYASAIQTANIEYDMLFGPAYKGIPLASTVAISLADDHNVNVPYCFNRKEVKDHGEGGSTFGAPLKGKIMIIDDVISAGTSVNLSVEIIKQAGATTAGVAIALDRQERGEGELSAVQEVEQRHQIEVISIVTLENMIEYLEKTPAMTENLDKIRRYRESYGAIDN